MDLRKEWQQLHQEKFNYSPIEKETIMNAIYQESNSTISTLKKGLGKKMNWIIFFVIIFGAATLFNWENADLFYILGFVTFYYIFGLVGIWLNYRKMSKQIDFSSQTLALMKTQDKLMKNALNFEKIWGLIFFPLAALAGLLIGNVAKGKVIADLIQDPTFLMIAIVCIIILVPLAHLGSNKLNKMSYGALMERLQNNIRRMEDLN